MKKRCTRCKTEKSIDEFQKDISRIDGKRPYCKTCVKIHVAKKAEEREKLLGDCEIHHVCLCKKERMRKLESENWWLKRELARIIKYDSRHPFDGDADKDKNHIESQGNQS